MLVSPCSLSCFVPPCLRSPCSDHSPECPELRLRHATRAAIDAGDVWQAERLVRESSFAHLLAPPAAASGSGGGGGGGASAGPGSRGGASAGASTAAASAAASAHSDMGGGSGSAAGGGGSAHNGSAGGSAADAAADVHLHLSCQKFVELVRGAL